MLTLQNIKGLLGKLDRYVDPEPHKAYHMRSDAPYAIMMNVQGYEIGEEVWLSYDDDDNIVFTVDAPETGSENERAKWEF